MKKPSRRHLLNPLAPQHVIVGFAGHFTFREVAEKLSRQQMQAVMRGMAEVIAANKLGQEAGGAPLIERGTF